MRILAAALIAATFQTAAQAADDARFREIGACMAYLAVASGMDGRNAVPESVSVPMTLLGGEFMFEATALGYSDDEAHTYVVRQLARQNETALSDGVDALHEEHGKRCAALADALAG